MVLVGGMSWIDIYLSDGNPNSILGADAQTALTRMLKWRDLPYRWLVYRKSGLSIKDSITFLILDVLRNHAYKKGFSQTNYFRDDNS